MFTVDLAMGKLLASLVQSQRITFLHFSGSLVDGADILAKPGLGKAGVPFLVKELGCSMLPL